MPRPEPTRQDDAANPYVFEKGVTFNNGNGTTSFGRIDLYCRGCFVLESKQGSEQRDAERALSNAVQSSKQRSGTAKRGTRGWDQAMAKARQQARRYAEALPDEWPPLLIVCDVGHCIDVYADFARTGKNYAPFPDPQSYRSRIEQLADENVRERLRLAWLDPLALDPGRPSAKVTRQLAAKLAELAKRLERRSSEPRPSGSGQRESQGERLSLPHGRGSDYTPDAVAQFLMRCLFTVFAEDVGLIPKNGFHDLLVSLRDSPGDFAPMAESLWATMDTGGFSPILRKQLCGSTAVSFPNGRRCRSIAISWSCSSKPARPNGPKSNPRSSARCSSGHSIRGSGTSSGRITRRGAMSNGSSCPRSWSRCGPSGTTSTPPR